MEQEKANTELGQPTSDGKTFIRLLEPRRNIHGLFYAIFVPNSTLNESSKTLDDNK